MVLDELDRNILQALAKDGRKSYRALANMLSSTTPTISSRVRRMEQLGVIAGYTIRLGHTTAPVVPRDIAVPCHTCQQQTARPVILNLEGTLHPFCCPVCKAQFAERFARIKKDSSMGDL